MSCYIPVVDKKNLFMPYLFNSATITARNSNHICNIHLLQPRMITTIRPYLTRHRDIPTTPAPSSDTKYRQSITISLSLWLYLHPPPPQICTKWHHHDSPRQEPQFHVTLTSPISSVHQHPPYSIVTGPFLTHPSPIRAYTRKQRHQHICALQYSIWHTKTPFACAHPTPTWIHSTYTWMTISSTKHCRSYITAHPSLTHDISSPPTYSKS